VGRAEGLREVKPATDPARACALLVGVEASTVYGADPLVGPVADALRCFDWLVGRGVPTANIQLFLSPKPDSQPLLQAWKQRQGDAGLHGASEHEVATFIATELKRFNPPPHQPGLLFVLWSGHGLIEHRGERRTRRLFFADSLAERPLHVDLNRLLAALDTPRFAGFTEQVLVVDACASFVGRMFRGQRLEEATNLGPTAERGKARQFTMVSASPGQLARTEPAQWQGVDATLSKFVNRFVKALDKQAAPAGRWPDFAGAFEVAKASFDRHDEQLPMSWAWGEDPANLSDDDLAVLHDAALTGLLRRLEGAGLEPRQLREPFMAALQLTLLAESHERALLGEGAGLVELLGEAARLPGPWTAPERFAIEVAVRRPTEAAAPPYVGGVLQRGHAPGAVQQAMDEARQRRERLAAGVCYLLVKDDGELHGDLFFEDDPKPVRLAPEALPAAQAPWGGERALGRLIELALATATGRLKDPLLVVEKVLSTECLHEDIDAGRFHDGADDQVLGHHHLVVRRLKDNLDMLSAMSDPASAAAPMGFARLLAWRREAEALRTRLRQHGLHLLWLAPRELLADKLHKHLNAEAAASCIALDLAVCGGRLDDDARRAIRRSTLPFACWPTDAWTDADKATLQAALAEAPCPALHDVFRLRKAHGFEQHPATRLAILWDDPAHNPYVTRLDAGGART
jgi:hypothetical protein